MLSKEWVQKEYGEEFQTKVACTCRKHCDNYPAVVCSEGGPPDWGADGLGSRNLCGKKADHVCVEKRTGQWELLGRESGVVHGGLGWSIVMTTLCGAFQCVLLHAVVHLSAFQCKSWIHGGLGWSIVMTTLEVHFSKSACMQWCIWVLSNAKAGCIHIICFFQVALR